MYKHKFFTGALGYTGGYFGEGSGPIHLDYVVCSGTEYNFTDCVIRDNTRQSSHSEDVGVKCQTSKGTYHYRRAKHIPDIRLLYTCVHHMSPY